MIAGRPIDPLEPPVRPTGVAPFEHFLRCADGLDVEEQDLKRYRDFINHKIYELVGRRGFLGALVASAATTMSRPAAGCPGEPNDKVHGPRYRETEHVKTFYRLSRYPGDRPC